MPTKPKCKKLALRLLKWTLSIVATIAVALVTGFYWHYAPEYEVVAQEELSQCTEMAAGSPPEEIWAALRQDLTNTTRPEEIPDLFSQCRNSDFAACAELLGVEKILLNENEVPEQLQTIKFYNEYLVAAVDHLMAGEENLAAIAFIASLQNLTVLAEPSAQSRTRELRNLLSVIFSIRGTDTCDKNDETCIRLSVLLADYLYRTGRYSKAKQVMNFAITSTVADTFSAEKILDQYYLYEEQYGQEPITLIQALFNAALERQAKGDYEYAGARFSKLGNHIQENYWQWASKNPDTPDQCVIDTMRYSFLHSDRLLTLALSNPAGNKLSDQFLIYSLRASVRRRAPDG